MSRLADWTIAINEIGSSGIEVTRGVNEAERQSLADDLGLAGCDKLTVRLRLRPLNNGRFLVTGTIEGDVTQRCIVTLDPVHEAIRETVDVEFWPRDQLSAPGEEEREVLGRDDPEPIEGGRLAVGRVVVELVAAGLDPYPRLPDATLEVNESGPSEEGRKSGPFAALEVLKKGRTT